MRRGDIVIGRDRSAFAGKARPMLVIQSDIALNDPSFVTVCPITSTLSPMTMVRVAIDPAPETGLERESQVEVDLVTTIRAEHITRTVGRASVTKMIEVDTALRRWLDL